jgi:hypothetical protein
MRHITGFQMRHVVYALVALSFSAMTPGPAAAQYGPGPDDRRGPPSYYTGRPPVRQENYEPPQRRPFPDAQRRYDQTGGDARLRSRPPDYEDGRPAASPSRVVRRAPVTSDSYRRFWDDGDNRRGATVTNQRPAPIERGPSRVSPDGGGGPVNHVAVGPGEMVISIAEYQSLQRQVRELQRLQGGRTDFHDDRDFRDDREFHNDRPGARSGPVEIYR